MILGISGLAGSGKDTCADLLVKEGWVKMGLADELKRIAMRVYDFSVEQLWGSSKYRNAPDYRYPRAGDEARYARACLVDYTDILDRPDLSPEWQKKIADWRSAGWLTPRYALQQLGSEWGRNCYENTWIDLTLRDAALVLGGQYGYDQMRGMYQKQYVAEPPKGVVISDARFRNELVAIRATKGGRVLRLYRPGAGLEGGAGDHVSEQEQLLIPDHFFDALHHSTGTLEELPTTFLPLVARLQGV